MRWFTHFLLPSAAASAVMLPSPANTAATFSATRGGATTSVATRDVHLGCPLPASNASTSPLSVPTTAMPSSAPTPPASVLPALVRQTERPVCASRRVTLPSVDAAYTASPTAIGVKPGMPLPIDADHATLACADALSSGSGPGFLLLPHSERSENEGGTGRYW